MLGEIQRLDSALDVAQGENRQVSETLNAERRAHEQTRIEVLEAMVIAAEREKSIQDRSEELRDARRQLGEATAQSTRLDAGAQKIGKLEAALEEEREARKLAEKALADLRVRVGWATLTERAAQAEKLQAFMALRHPQSVAGQDQVEVLTRRLRLVE